MKTLYTFGYQGAQPQVLQDHLNRLDAVLVDIRYNPRSRNQTWNKANLQHCFGERYVHLPELGNVNYNNGGPIKIADMGSGEGRIVAMMQTKAVILMCVCANVNTCHRKVVANALAKALGWQVEHLR